MPTNVNIQTPALPAGSTPQAGIKTPSHPGFTPSTILRPVQVPLEQRQTQVRKSPPIVPTGPPPYVEFLPMDTPSLIDALFDHFSNPLGELSVTKLQTETPLIRRNHVGSLLSTPTVSTLTNVECALNKISEQLTDNSEKFAQIINRINQIESSITQMKQESANKIDNYIEEIKNVAHNMAKSQQILSEDCHAAVANITKKCNRVELQYLTINQNICNSNKILSNLQNSRDAGRTELSPPQTLSRTPQYGPPPAQPSPLFSQPPPSISRPPPLNSAQFPPLGSARPTPLWTVHPSAQTVQTPPEQQPTEAQTVQTPPIQQPLTRSQKGRKGKGLWVASSIGSNIDKQRFSEQTESEIKYAKAYTAKYDESARFPNQNLWEVVPAEIEKDTFDWLGMETGANVISNLDLNLDHDMHLESWKEQIYNDSKATFDLARKALEKHKSLQKVIIMKRVPRYDNSVRADLTKYGNFINEKLWIENGCPSNIVIGETNLECFGKLRDLRYGDSNLQVCDNIHLRGTLGESHFTNAIVHVFKLAFPFLQSTKSNYSPPPRRNHTPLEQRQSMRRHHYKSAGSAFPHTAANIAWQTPKVTKPFINPWQQTTALPLFNRFANLSNC